MRLRDEEAYRMLEVAGMLGISMIVMSGGKGKDNWVSFMGLSSEMPFGTLSYTYS